MAKILITESVHPIGPELLTAAGHTVVYADRDMDVIRREIVDADAVLVRIIELPGSLLATAKNLKIVSKHGVGYDNIDLDYCKSHGIAVTIESMHERETERGPILDIEANIFCEKASHKGIIIGKNGAMLGKIGEMARKDMESFLDTKVYLKTWVKVKENWRDSQPLLRNFGFND